LGTFVPTVRVLKRLEPGRVGREVGGTRGAVGAAHEPARRRSRSRQYELLSVKHAAADVDESVVAALLDRIARRVTRRSSLWRECA
jgi:hypothetical protein